MRDEQVVFIVMVVVVFLFWLLGLGLGLGASRCKVVEIRTMGAEDDIYVPEPYLGQVRIN